MKRLSLIFIIVALMSACGEKSNDTTYEECLANLGNEATSMEVAQCYEKYNEAELCEQVIDTNSENYLEDYSGISHISTFCNIIPEGNYFIYFYEDTCLECMEIKDDIVRFGLSENEDYDVYFVNVSENEFNGDTFTQNTSLTQVPSIIYVVDGFIVDEIDNDEIVDFLTEVENNQYFEID
ncbi:hypothetical protein [Candidatus Xianfuyuplasma coldseepsis]|uniref:Thioredoxin domain-containing protein n=1 Tax=Candidatus Xianfuyuplasma coldseepsis TaxID=2782163 RepID=A0A7L7KTJ6_9MOLU|nr:hypothetical protein [Xianfuyuplasma coldseepsis]QMS85739.1 hypothetical protein G4Z02_08280 [Xianfuyuplasma coldseepsis]